nr:NADH dehydrogenase subunit 6 [Cyttopsis rosea]
MPFTLLMLLFGLIGGLIGVAANPSPYYGALCLVMVSGGGAGISYMFGGGFLALILFLVYLGGMLVVFVFSAALYAKPHPSAWGITGCFLYSIIYLLLFLGTLCVEKTGWFNTGTAPIDELKRFYGIESAPKGVSMVYKTGAFLFISTGLVVVLAVIIIWVLIFGGDSSSSAVRAV